MCFSAKASFLASGVLLTAGAATLGLARGKLDRQIVPLAMAPLFFGLQQALEGLVWLGLDSSPQITGGAPAPITVNAVLAYLFFAYAFWPVWIPWSAARLLPGSGGRWEGLLALGLVPGLVLWLPLLIHPESALPFRIGHSLVYPLHPWSGSLLPPMLGSALYAAWMVIPLLLVPSWRVRAFALTLLVAFAITKWASGEALISVWCYASAVLSAQIFWILGEKSPIHEPQHPGPGQAQPQTP